MKPCAAWRLRTGGEVRTGINGGTFIHSGNTSGIKQVVQDMVSLSTVSIANVTEARIELMATAIRLACERATPRRAGRH